MHEVCYCGRAGAIEDRILIRDRKGTLALRCPNNACGHLEYLRWLPGDETRRDLFDDAARRHPELTVAAA